MVVNEEKIKQILEDPLTKIFYESIGYHPCQEIRIFIKDEKYPRSFFPTNFLETIGTLYKNRNHNCYVGVNPRNNMGKSSKDVAHRRMMVFDVEAIGEKPPLTDKTYKNKLKRSQKFIEAYIEKKCKAKITFISTSGRGLHLYVKIKPLDAMYQEKYKLFYTELICELNHELKKIGIKCDPPLSDLARILGAISTKNVKYVEDSAFREIIHYEDVETDLEPTLNSYKAKPLLVEKKELMSIEEIRNRPEYQIFSYGMNPESGINNYIRFSLKLLMRKASLSIEAINIIAKEIQEMGYPYKPMYIADDANYVYSKKILQKYCYNNFAWCVKKNFPFPYLEKIRTNNYELDDKQEFPVTEIKTWGELIEYAALFNKTTRKNIDGEYVYYTKSLMQHLKKCCSTKLYSYIEDNNLIDHLKYRTWSKEDH